MMSHHTSDFHEYTADPSQKMPWEYLEPMDDGEAAERAEVLVKLFDLLFPSGRGHEALEAGWRRFVALASIIRPDLLGGLTQTAMAQLMGVTPAAVSKQCNALADALGIRGNGMKSEAAREKMSRGQRDRCENFDKGSAIERHAIAVRRACTAARKKLVASRPWSESEIAAHLAAGHVGTTKDGVLRLTDKGRQEGVKLPTASTWSKFERLALWERGFLDDGGKLTRAGITFMEGATDGPTPPPHKESLQ